MHPSGHGPVKSLSRVTPEKTEKSGRSRIGSTLSRGQVAEEVYQVPNSLHSAPVQHVRNRLMWRTDAGITARLLIGDA